MQNLIRLLRSVLSGAPVSNTDISETIRNRLIAARMAGRPIQCNLGCGTRHHPDWINIDFHGDGEAVLSWDLQKGLPLPPQSCDVVYSSHAIEHFDRIGARRFLDECRRVLKSGGILRLAAPDLEGITRTYISCLDAARRGEPGAADRYEWMVIELLDQLVRHRSGGEMLKYWSRDEVPEDDFVSARVGVEYHRARMHWKGRVIPDRPVEPEQLGLFRLGGEVHQWMYDAYSLGKLLGDCGFVGIVSLGADESQIDGFSAFNLDTEPDGTVYKPDSFFIEAKAP